MSNMSEVSFEKSPKEIMKYLERALVYGWNNGLERSILLPWADALDTIDEIADFTAHFYWFGNDEYFIDFLSKLSGIGYDTFKEMWNKLSEKQRAKVIDVAARNIALIGLKKLFRWIVKKLGRKKYKEARAKVLQAAKDYLNGKIDKSELMDKIREALWPTEDDELESGYEFDDFLSAETLVEFYIDNEDFEEYVRKYLVDRLEKLE